MKKFIVLLLMSVTLFSCSLDDDTVNFYYEYLATQNVQFPEDMALGGTYEVTMYYTRPNECYTVQGITYQNTGTLERLVAINAQVSNSDTCQDATDTGIETITFDFQPQVAGTYTFNFLSTYNESTSEYSYLTYEVEVTTE